MEFEQTLLLFFYINLRIGSRNLMTSELCHLERHCWIFRGDLTKELTRYLPDGTWPGQTQHQLEPT